MTPSSHTYHVDESHTGDRLDVFLSAQSSYSRSQIKKLVDTERILISGTVAKKAGHIIHSGDTISIEQKTDDPLVRQDSIQESSIYAQIRVIAETPDYLVVYKPAGLLVHPTLANESATLTAWLVSRYPDITSVGEHSSRPGIVHRLDKDASGLLVIARTQDMHEHLKAQFKARTIKKEYTVLVYGTIDQDSGTIDFAIDRGKEGRMVARPKLHTMSLDTVDDIQPGKDARTEFRVLHRYGRYTLLSVRIHSGRTHQIRVHMYAYAHPVVGDTLYMNKKLIKRNDTQLTRLFLHATTLCFADKTGQTCCFDAPLPEELQSYLNTLV